VLGESEIERIDIKTEVGRHVADDRCRSFGDHARAEFVFGPDDRGASCDCPVVNILLNRRADANLHRMPRINQPLLEA
jgi:hypothetical protein